MAAQTEEIAGLVESVIRPLIDNPDDLVIDARETEDGSIFVEVRVNEEDAGKVIGDTGINISGVGGYAGEIEYFASCVARGEAPTVVTPDSSLASVRLVERILENSIVL